MILAGRKVTTDTSTEEIENYSQPNYRKENTVATEKEEHYEPRWEILQISSQFQDTNPRSADEHLCGSSQEMDFTNGQRNKRRWVIKDHSKSQVTNSSQTYTPNKEKTIFGMTSTSKGQPNAYKTLKDTTHLNPSQLHFGQTNSPFLSIGLDEGCGI